MAGVKDEFDKLSEQLGDMVEEMLSRNFFRYAKPDTWRPNVNVYETAAGFLVCVDLAGIEREQIDVQVKGRWLLIRGTRPKPLPDTGTAELCVHVMEIDSGRFARKLQMPAVIDTERVTADYRNGYLWITLPRDKPAAGARTRSEREGNR
ncbi:MAG TPA: Hsp20/alpha crystallin family protein [Phycisphaerae bacterium]|jgi:HSP20 family molecular chaperone IbpA